MGRRNQTTDEQFLICAIKNDSVPEIANYILNDVNILKRTTFQIDEDPFGIPMKGLSLVHIAAYYNAINLVIFL